MNKKRFTIGEVSSICNVSKKALRYYDKIGLIKSERDDSNNYRYYSCQSLLAVPVIKYYKQMGFKLDEMKGFIEGIEDNVYREMQRSFSSKIKELKKTQEETQRKYVSVKDWYDLIVEAEMVIDNNIKEVSVKYIESEDYLFLDQEFENNIEASIINIEFTNYVESVKNEITGPVLICFSSFKNRMENKNQKIKILQKTLMDCKPDQTIKFGGEMMLSCYHIGSHDKISETYEKMCSWARRHEYVLAEECCERYVTDYWTTSNNSQFVTEVLVKVSRKK
jgi:DNA-binding transcriptional MerR regulator